MLPNLAGIGQGMSRNGRRAAAGQDEGAEHFNQGCLARPVWPQQPEQFPGLDGQADVVDGRCPLTLRQPPPTTRWIKGLGQIVGFNSDFGHKMERITALLPVSKHLFISRVGKEGFCLYNPAT